MILNRWFSDGNKVSYSDIVRIFLHCLNGTRSHAGASQVTGQEVQVFAQMSLVNRMILQRLPFSVPANLNCSSKK